MNSAHVGALAVLAETRGSLLLRRMLSLTVATIGTLALAGCPASTIAASTADHPRASEVDLDREVLDLVNRHRAARGLPALAFDPRIAREAQRHSAAMASGSRPLGHAGFADRIAALRRVMPCGASAENVASSLGYDDPAPEVVRGWLASSGHRRNIEGRYDITGVGVARSASGKLYFTQIFVGRESGRRSDAAPQR